MNADDDIDSELSAETERIPDGDAPLPVENLKVGALLDGRYEIRSVIGSGGAGRVYRAHDRVLGEDVAVKVLHPARAAHVKWIRRMAREVRVARAIRHPNVCRVFDLGQADGFCFVTMELAEGGTLRQLLRARAAAPVSAASFPERLHEARAVCAGLAAIHAAGITHRDVTPGNVLCMRDGRLVISDFGLAVGIDESTTFHGGTPQYMAPEVLAGAVADTRADVWQLGMVMHQILFGRRPDWDRIGERTSLKRPAAAAATPVAERAFAVVAACLAPDLAARPEQAVEVARLLAAAESARAPSRAARAAGWIGRGVRRPAVRLAALLVAVGAGAFAVARQPSSSAPRQCGGGRSRVADVWDAPRREAVRRAFAATGRTSAPEVFAQVSRLVDGHLADWVTIYDDSCEATHVRGEQSADVLDLRTACLNDDLESIRALTRVFADADATLVDNAAAAAGSLTLTRCSDVRLLRFGPPLPRDPEVRRRVEVLRRSLGDARALLEASRQRSCVRAAADVAARAEALGYKPLVADALALEGQAKADLFDFEGAIPLLERAVTLAEEGADDRVVARAATNLTYAASQTSGRDAREWLTLARAALVRIGGDPEIAWLLHHVEVVYHLARGEAPAALESGLEAVRIAERLFGPGHAQVGYALNNVALAYDRLGRFEEALQATDRSLAIGRRWLEPASIQIAKLENNRGEYLLSLGRPAEAREMFETSLAAFETETTPDSLLMSAPLVGLGRALLALGKPADAIPLLERALRLRDHGQPIQPWVAEAEFRLAQALDAAGRDRGRARRLAAAAQDGYAKAAGFAKERDAVQAWATARR